MKDDIQKALEVLKRGGVILFPTDTHWSLGCDATNKDAVARLLQVKKKEPGNRLLLLMENPALLERYVADVPDIAWDLAEISTTPLTMVFSNPRNLPENVVARDGTVGIRFTREDFSRELVQRFRRPVLASSANYSGMQSPSVFLDVDDDIRNAADYVVAFRQDDPSPAVSSSIIRLGAGGRIDIIRE
jgi:L-threonylcarbamoyladenylate synthase